MVSGFLRRLLEGLVAVCPLSLVGSGKFYPDRGFQYLAYGYRALVKLVRCEEAFSLAG